MEEVVRRYRLRALRFHAMLDRAEQTDWLEVGRHVLKQAVDNMEYFDDAAGVLDKSPTAPQLVFDLRLGVMVSAEIYNVLALDPAYHPSFHKPHPTPAGANVPPEELLPEKLRERSERLNDAKPGYRQVMNVLAQRHVAPEQRLAAIKAARAELAKVVKAK